MESEHIPEGSEDPLERAMREHPGSWITWNKARTIIVIADTYDIAMRQAIDSGEVDLVIEKATGIHPVVAARPFVLLEDESEDIIEDVRRMIPDADEWLDTPNIHFGLVKPRDLIGTSGERQLRYLLRGIGNGITT